MEVLTPRQAMRCAHNNYAQLGVVNIRAQTYLMNISEFLISNMTFHTPSPLVCHKGNHPTAPLSQSMCGFRDDQKSTKSQIAFMRSGFFFSAILFCATIMAATIAKADEITIATASNFSHTLRVLSNDFTQKTGHKVKIIQGSSGALANQIIHGLPVDMFLSADQHRIEKVIKAGAALPKNQFTYAIGQLTLWSANKTLIPASASPASIAKLISSPQVSQIAIANPKLAPFGVATLQVLRSIGSPNASHDKIIYAQNIAQTFTLAIKGGTSIAFIARSQALASPKGDTSSHWHIPANLHEPIKQDGVIVKSSRNKKIAKVFTAYLKSAKAILIITKHGYKRP